MDKRHKNILFVSNTGSIKDQISNDLKLDHFTLSFLESLAQVPDFLDQNKVDLLIVEISKNELSKISILKMMKSFESMIPLLLISSDLSIEEQENIFTKTTAREILIFPIHSDILLKCIESILYPDTEHNSEDFFEIIYRNDFIILRHKKEIPSFLMNHYYHQIVECIHKKKDMVVDLFFIEHMSNLTFVCFDVIYKLLKLDNRQIIFINSNELINNGLESFGFKRQHHIDCNINKMIKNFNQKSPVKLGLNFVKALVISTIKTMFVQNLILCNRQSSYLLNDNKDFFPGEIGATIKIEIENLYYYLSISLSKTIYLKILSNLLDQDFSQVTKENSKGIGDLLKVIIDQTIEILSHSKSKITSSIPYIHVGKSYSSIQELKSDFANAMFDKWNVIIVPFMTNYGDFYMQLGFSENCTMEQVNSLITY